MYEKKGPPLPKANSHHDHTIKTLRLNVEAALSGRAFNLMPLEFQAQECGKVYPLPTNIEECRQLCQIEIPYYGTDAGSVYLRRVRKRHKDLQRNRQSSSLDTEKRRHIIAQSSIKFKRAATEAERELAGLVDGVREEAEKASASLTSLFALGRRGIEGQMQAHLNGATWKEESINALAFRQCFQMVTQAVKGLGLPSDQKSNARDAVIEEYAAALKDTREAIKVGVPEKDSETSH